MRMMREERNKRSEGQGDKLRPFLWGGGILLLGVLLMTWWGGSGIEETEVVPKRSAGRMVLPDDSSDGKKPAVVREKAAGDLSATENSKSADPKPGVVQKAEDKGTSEPETPHVEEFTFYKTLAQQKPVGINGIKMEGPAGETAPEKTSAEAPPKPVPSQPKTAGIEPPPSDHQMYTIQVAAFREKDRAEGMIENLKQKGYPAYLQIKEGNMGPDWFRVRVGKFPEPEEAHLHAETIRGKEGLPPFVTLASN